MHIGCGVECKICQVAKQRRAQHKPIPESDAIYAKKMYEKTSFDHLEIDKHKLCEGVGGVKYALCSKDEASDFAHFYPDTKKDGLAVATGLRDHFGADLRLAGKFYADGAQTFAKVARILRVPERNSTPYTPTSNARHERWMGTLGDGIRGLLYSSGLSLAWWPFAGKYYCLAHNLLKVNKRSGKTPYDMRYPNNKSPTLHPFGCRVTYVPMKDANGKTKQPFCEPRAAEGILLGYVVPPGEPMTREAIIAPLSNFNGSKLLFRIITTRDYRFHGIEYPRRELRLKAQLLNYNAVNPALTEDQYRTMIFGPVGGQSVVVDINSGALIDNSDGSFIDNPVIDESELIDIGPVQDGPNPVELGPPVPLSGGNSLAEPLEQLDVIINVPVGVNVSAVPPVPSSEPVVAVPPVIVLTQSEKDRLKQLKAYAFFDKMKKKTPKPPTANTASSSNSPFVAAPTIVEFACSNDSSLGRVAMDKGIDSIRLTKDYADLTTRGGYLKALQLVKKY